MKTRPQIVKGDIVKLSKKAKGRYIPKYSNVTMIALLIDGDGVDHSCYVDVVCGKDTLTFRRDELWKTGYNVNNDLQAAELSIDAPVNNNGRDTCYVCKMPNKDIVLLASEHQVCSNSSCIWFEN